MPDMTEIHFANSIESNIHLSLYYCGKADCAPGHSWGPFVRDHYLIHYVVKGKGTYQIGDRIYTLCKGEGFLISPGIRTTYIADFNDPWTYYWVGFDGLNAGEYLERAGLSSSNPIFIYSDIQTLTNCFIQMLECSKNKKSRDLKYFSLLYLFLSLLVESNENKDMPAKVNSLKEYYIKSALKFIYMNYSRKISIQEVAEYVGLSRKYLFFLFKGALGTSPQEYLIHFRMHKACELMESSTLSIGDISRSVGYDNQLLFSKMFKKAKGMTPKAYRQHLTLSQA
jgi:AraC-like DNA-binding protein